MTYFKHNEAQRDHALLLSFLVFSYNLNITKVINKQLIQVILLIILTKQDQ